MLPCFKVLKGLIGIDVSHFVDFYTKNYCDYYSFRHYDHLMLEKLCNMQGLIPLNILISIQE